MEIQRYAVLIKRPEPTELMGLTQTAKYAYLQKHSEDTKEHLLNWLKKKHLIDQVQSVEPSNAFNTLFFNTTRQVGRALEKNAEVVRVAEDRPLPLVLNWTTE